MLKVENKFIFIGLVGLALALIFWPFAGMYALSDFALWQILCFYITIILPAHIGHQLLSNIWGMFDMKKGATQKH